MFANFSWLNATHPDWILYKCDRKTVQVHDKDMPFIDVTNPAFLAWQLGQMSGKESQLIQKGYNGIAIDNFLAAIAGTSGPCGHFAKDGSWVQQYTGSLWDPAWLHDQLGWLKSFYAGLQSTPAAYRPLLILNTDLSFMCDQGCNFSSETILTIGNHTDGVLNEGAWGWDANGHLHL